jgi:alpha-galactosidase
MAGIGFSQSDHAKHAAPGHWNDPDMLVVGKVGWGPSLHPTRLTPNEQYTHISLWCLLSAPLLIGCDLTQLDDFTLGLLTNDEVLEVDQDPSGSQATLIRKDGFGEAWAKKMSDGSWAIGLFNRGYAAGEVSLPLADLGISGGATVRDLWRQKDLAPAHGTLTASVPKHGCALVKVRGK